MTSLREAVDRIALVREATQFGSIEADPEYKTFDTLADAALAPLLSILDASEEVSWCEFHKAAGETGLDCWGAGINGQDQCTLVSVRFIPSSLLAGLGET